MKPTPSRFGTTIFLKKLKHECRAGYPIWELFSSKEAKDVG
jgi:hypothetical protein